jgi:hypothetical protein
MVCNIIVLIEILRPLPKGTLVNRHGGPMIEPTIVRVNVAEPFLGVSLLERDIPLVLE